MNAEDDTITPFPKIIMIHPIISADPNLPAFLIISQNEFHADVQKFSLCKAI
jgi:hypothetical protein